MLSFYLSILDTDEKKSKFERLYFRYRQEMYVIALSILKNNEDAEDAVHNAFIRIANNIDKVSDVECPKTHSFIVIITKNISIDFFRSINSRSRKTVNIESARKIPDLEVFFEKIEYSCLVNTIKTLHNTHKDILFLKYVNNLSIQEMSVALGISSTAVYKRIQRAKEALKEQLDVEGADYG